MNNIGSEAIESPNSGTKVPLPNKTNGTDTLVLDNAWRECKLGDVLNFGNGKSRPKIEGKYPIYGGNGILGYANEFNYADETIILGRVGAYCGSVYYENKPIWVSDNALSAKPKEGNYTKFLYYFLKHMDLNSHAGGSSHPLITQSLLNSLEIEICTDYEEQKAIAEVLSSLDDKIDLLHRQNRTLESLAQTLFRQWFIEEAKDEWEVGILDDIVDFNPSYKLKQGELATYLAMESVRTDRSSVNGWYKREVASGAKFMNNDTLLARITPSLENGKTAFVDFLEDDEIGWGSTEFIVMRMKNGYHPFISYLIARNQDFRDFAIGNMTGSTGRQRAQAEDLKKYEIAIPPFDEIQKLNKHLEPIPPKIKANWQQIQTLENLRDTLLPKLLSGEVRVEI